MPVSGRCRGVLAFVAVALLASPVVSAEAGGFKGDFQGPVGLQAWSLREEFKKEPALAVKIAKEAGFDEVEGCLFANLPAAEMRKLLDAQGIRCTSMHRGYDDFAKKIDDVIATAKVLGCEAVGIPWIPHKTRGKFTREEALKAAADFNSFGEKVKAAGLKFFYHLHGYEFQPSEEGTLFDLLMQKTTPGTVWFQMDVFWVVRPGHDPVKLLKKYPDRWLSLHLKDMQKGAATGELTGAAPKEWDVPLGTGQIDLPSILQTASQLGVKRYYIEDESAEAAKQIGDSLKYLQGVHYGQR